MLRVVELHLEKRVGLLVYNQAFGGNQIIFSQSISPYIFICLCRSRQMTVPVHRASVEHSCTLKLSTRTARAKRTTPGAAAVFGGSERFWRAGCAGFLRAAEGRQKNALDGLPCQSFDAAQ